MADSVARVLALAALNGGGGGGDVPENRKVPTSTTADAGKLLAVGANGTRAWTTVFTLTDTTLDITVPEVASNNALGNTRTLNEVPVIRFLNNEEPEVNENIENPEVNEPEAEPESEEPEIEEEIPEENEEEVPEEE